MNALGYALNTAGIISILVGTILPLITAFVTKESWNREVKGLVLFILATATSVLSQLAQSLADKTHFDWKGIVLTTLVTYGTAYFSHSAVWRGSAVQGTLASTGISDTPAVAVEDTIEVPDAGTGTGVVPDASA